MGAYVDWWRSKEGYHTSSGFNWSRSSEGMVGMKVVSGGGRRFGIADKVIIESFCRLCTSTCTWYIQRVIGYHVLHAQFF